MYSTLDLKNLIRQPYAWPGGYPRYAIMADCEALCVKCCKSEFKLILKETRDKGTRSGWCFYGVDINWEDNDLYCVHCGDRIESAYGDDE